MSCKRSRPWLKGHFMQNPVLEILLSLVVAAAGSILFLRLKVPAGALVGALILTALLKIATDVGMMPRTLKLGIQIIAGAFVGQRIHQRDLKEIRSIIKPIALYLTVVFVLVLLMGFLVERLTALDRPTAMLSVLPGGITEIAVTTEELGADPTKTTVIQLCRYIFALLILPQVDARLCAKFDPRDEGIAPEGKTGSRTWKHALLTLAACTAAGILGKLSGIPSAALMCSMITAAVISIKTGAAYIPKLLRWCAQGMAGCMLGVTVTMADILMLPSLAGPILLVLLNCLLINFGIGWVMWKTSGLSLSTCLFGCVPAGMSDMALISLDMGGDAPKVMAMQLTRYILVLGIMPSVIRWLSGM